MFLSANESGFQRTKERVIWIPYVKVMKIQSKIFIDK